ncbi:MAG: hypothetical protein ACI9WU_001854, partial [Myxococcota bacterium]
MRRLRPVLCLAIGLLLSLPGCSEAEAPVEVRAETALGPRDAGDEAFVKRAVALMWGRKPTSIVEVGALVQVIAQTDRSALILAMAKSPEYRERWETWVRDALSISRIGYYSNAGCYGRRTQPEDL